MSIPMKSIVLLSIVFVLVLCQTSSNPNGAPFFSSSLVRELPLNSTISSTILNTTGYMEFYWVYIPDYVGEIKYSLNRSGICNNYVYVVMSFVTPGQDASSSFNCPGGDLNHNLCYNGDYTLYAGDASSDIQTITVHDFRPAEFHYLTVYLEYSDTPSCNYSISADVTFQCPPDKIVGYDYMADYQCLTPTNNVTFSGQNFSGIFNSASQVDIYAILVPQNVSRLWAWVSSNSSDLSVCVTGGFAATDYSSADYAVTSGSYNSADGLYYYKMEYALPSGNVPHYFTVNQYLPHTQVWYNISVYWSACGAAKAGYGVFTGSYGSNTFATPDCNLPVLYNNMNILSGNQTYVFPGGFNYAFFNVPFGTVGYVNITCSNVTSSAFVSFVKGGMTSYDTYEIYLSNNGDYLELLSHDLYPGGYWTVAVSGQVDLVVTGSVTLPASPSASAVASPSASPDSDLSNSSPRILTPSILLLACVALSVLL